MHQLILRQLGPNGVDHNSAESFDAKVREVAAMTGRDYTLLREVFGVPSNRLTPELLGEILFALGGAFLDADVKFPLKPRALS
jgi:hypothetical protein